MAAVTAAPAERRFTTPSSVSGSKSPSAPTDAKRLGWWAILKQTIADWLEDKAAKLAASLALYAMLSIAPLLVIMTKVVGVIFRDEAEQGRVAKFMQGVMPGVTGDALTQVVHKASQPGQGVLATVLSTLLAIFGATGVFGELQDSMNTIWEVKPKPNRGIWGFIRTRFLSFAMVLGLAFLIMVSTIGTTLITTLGGWISNDSKIVGYLLTTVISLGVMTVLFAAIFKVLPDANVRWKDVWVGAIATAVLFEVGKHLLSWYLKGSSTQVFGPASWLAALLLWIYYSAQILFLGAEFTQVWARAHGHEIVPSKDAVKVTEEDRAQQGIVSEDRLQQATRENRGHKGARQPRYVRPPANIMTPGVPTDGNGGWSPRQYALAAGGLVVGAVAGVLGAEYLLHDPKKPTAKHAAAVRLNQRLDRVEQKLGRVSRIRQYLEDMDVKQRIDKVEKEIRRAGTHVRAEETGRPKWAVKLADLIGGRWSNL